jgi:transcriptional regulator with XRE-family HTH domain
MRDFDDEYKLHNSPIPERLKLARKKVGISQKELGVRIGMDESSASGRTMKRVDMYPIFKRSKKWLMN